MILATFFSWWYGVGWLSLGRKVSGRVVGVLRFFSVGQLATSLFAPFRQISAGRVQGPLGVQLRAWGDRQFSRVIGAIVRLMLIACGLAGALFYSITGLIMLVLWPVMPVMPLFGIILMATGFHL
ncbi:MAG TPA: hypothetical protein VFO38_04665 [Candidatus Saccharimonadales bacterium]|nr:hypothetical protein [Candidatus Saccharimonadales bacterium]